MASPARHIMSGRGVGPPMWGRDVQAFVDTCEDDGSWIRQASLSPDARSAIQDTLRAVFIHLSHALTDHPVSASDTARILDGEALAAHPASIHQALRDHAEAYDLMWDRATQTLTDADVCQLHAVLMAHEAAHPGVYRGAPTQIPGSVHAPGLPADIRPRMSTLVRRWNVLRTGYPVVVAAARLHHEFLSVFPFADGNGRLARLLTGQYLLRRGYPPALILAEDTDRYGSALDDARSQQEAPLIRILARGVHQAFQWGWCPYLPR